MHRTSAILAAAALIAAGATVAATSHASSGESAREALAGAGESGPSGDVISTAAATRPSDSTVRAATTITIASGPYAGRHTLSGDPPCLIVENKPPRPKHELESNLGLDNAGTKSNHDKFTMQRLTVADADARGATSELSLLVGFGDVLDDGTRYEIETRSKAEKSIDSPNKGSGSATVKQHGKDASVVYDVKTADGISIHGELECYGVIRY
jgi:hypothetical protein